MFKHDLNINTLLLTDIYEQIFAQVFMKYSWKYSEYWIQNIFVIQLSFLEVANLAYFSITIFLMVEFFVDSST